MELLVLVGLIVKGVVYTGYAITGSYLAGTGVRYYKDYKDSVSNEKG
jgi:energy-converting hydrogenase Eha subunit G